MQKQAIMRIILFVVLISLFFGGNLHAQERLTGTWQEKTNKVSSALLDNYSFNSTDSTFEFKPTEYNGLNRVLGLGGKFVVKNDTIFFFVNFMREYVGGYPERSRITTLSDSWELAGGEVTQKKLKNIINESASFDRGFDSKKNTDYISIDGNRFYRIPNE